MKRYLFIVVSLFLISLVSAQTIFSPPFPTITLRDANTHKIYSSVQLVGFVPALCTPYESDNGIDAFKQGTNIINFVPGVQPSLISDFNIAFASNASNTEVFELISGNYEVSTPTGWIPVPGGLSIGVILSSSMQGLGSENGLGSPNFANAIGPTYYFNQYTDRYGAQVTNARLYGAPKIAIDPVVMNQYNTPNINLYSVVKAFDIKDNILVVVSNYPLVSSAVTPTTQLFGQCPSLAYPTMSSNNLGSNCYEFNQYVSYIDYSTITPTTEALGPLIPATTAVQTGYHTLAGVYENNPSISRNPSAPTGAYLIARETNIYNFGTANFDVAVFNTDPLVNTDNYVVPELSPTNPLNQVHPDFNYPFISFLELPAGSYPNFPNNAPAAPMGSLHIVDLITNVRTVTPIAQAFGYPRILYDSTSNSGISVYQDASNGLLYYVTFTSSGFPGSISTPTQIPAPTNFGLYMGSNFAVAKKQSAGYIVYYISNNMITNQIELYSYDTNTNTNNLIYTDNMLSFFNFASKNELTYDARKSIISFRVAPIGGGILSSVLLNLNSQHCSTLPCSIYNSAPFFRQFPLFIGGNYASYFGSEIGYILDNDIDSTSPSVAGLDPFYPNPSYSQAMGFIDISNI
ncbi:hypothetical protein EXS72_02855 [Candidatus Pacearchaeota archaeon]|nr:hypothetical protein [Candidatus Pacearchaeota archaeon]